jgi:LacI family transcriptional regulator
MLKISRFAPILDPRHDIFCIMRQRPAVALLIETSNSYARGLLRGVKAYVREHEPWSIYLGEQGRGDSAPPWLARWHGRGIIARIENRRIADAVRRSGKAAVDVSAARLVPSLPYVETDDAAIARAAADHLLERGFKHFAYCGVDPFKWSAYRAEHFARYLRERGFDCHHYRPPRSGPIAWEQQQIALARWLRKLPRPVGVMAAYDIRGRQLLDACRGIDLAVPDEVAVVGVDNDELLCELADPPLSSVVPDAHRAGHTAAALLDRLMRGKLVPPEPVLIPPLGVATRRSTDVLATDDRVLAEAVRFIREHACEGINVVDVLRAVPLTRRVLEARFKDLTGRTPHEQIVKLRLDRVKELLAQTRLPLAVIARRAGFRHVEYLSAAFRRKIGQWPSEYRHGARLPASR